MSTRAEAHLDDTPEAGRKLLTSGFWLRLVAIFYVAFNFGKHGIYRPLTIHGVDYPKHWLAARAVLEGRSTYLGDELWMGFNYPQWSALVTAWLGWFDVDSGQIIWKMLQLLALVVSWWIAWRIFAPPRAADSAQELSSPAIRSSVAAGIRRHWGLTAAVLLFAAGSCHVLSSLVMRSSKQGCVSDGRVKRCEAQRVVRVEVRTTV